MFDQLLAFFFLLALMSDSIRLSVLMLELSYLDMEVWRRVEHRVER